MFATKQETTDLFGMPIHIDTSERIVRHREKKLHDRLANSINLVLFVELLDQLKAPLFKAKAAIPEEYRSDTGSGNTSTKRPKKAASEKSSKPEMTTTPQSEQVESNPQSPAPQKTSDKKSGAEGSAGSGKRSSEMMRSKLLSSLKPGNAILLGDVIDNFEKNTLTGQVADLGYGVGISNDELASHGQPVMELFEELAAKHWLWVDRSKPSRKLHLIDMDGKPVSMMILKSDIAVGLGVVGEKQNAPA